MSGNQRQSEAIRAPHWSSITWQSVAISGHQWPSVTITSFTLESPRSHSNHLVHTRITSFTLESHTRSHLVYTRMIGGAPELPNEGWLDAEHVRTIDEKANRRLAHVPADEHVIRGHQGSSVVIRGHQWHSPGARPSQ